MPQYHDVQTFIDLAQRTERPEDLYGLMHDVTREIGFDHFALIHHGDPPAGVRLDGKLVTRAYIGLSDYPPVLIRGEVTRDHKIRDHPILLASQRTATGFGWDRIDRMITVTSKHRIRVEDERRAGIGDGFTVPIHLPGGPGGSCSFAVRPGREVPRANLLMAQLVGSFAFEAARGLAARLNDVSPGRSRLTPRLRECIELAAQGKSDWEIARIVGLRETTVATYMQRARERFGVSTRMQVVLMALYDGEIDFTAIL